jgi:outer membrane protein
MRMDLKKITGTVFWGLVILLHLNAEEGLSSHLELIPSLKSSEQIQNISLQEAVLLALKNNGELHIKNIEVKQAQEKIETEKGVLDPKLLASVNMSRDLSAQTNRGTGSSYDVKNEGSELSLALTQPFSTGASVELITSLEQDVSNRTPEQQEARFGLTFTQPLLRGRGKQVVCAEILLSTMASELSRYEWKAYAEALVSNVESTYWKLVHSQEKVKLLEKSLEVALQNRENTLVRIEAGVASKIDAASVRSEVALRRQALIDSRSETVEFQWRLWSLMRTPASRSLPSLVAHEDPRENLEIDRSCEAFLLDALYHRSDLEQAQWLYSQRQLETVVTRQGVLPKLDFFTTLGKSGYESNAPKAYANVNEKAYDFSVGLELEYTLNARRAKGEHTIAIQSEEKAKLAIQNLKQQIELDVHLAYNEWQRCLLQVDASKTSVALQEETLRAETHRHESGLSTPYQLAQVQRDVLTTQLTYLEAKIALQRAHLLLYRSAGLLLEQRGVVLN